MKNMSNLYQSKVDVHTHTVASGHAYSTLTEMVTMAASRGLEILGITEHGPAIPGSCLPIYYTNLHVGPRMISGVRLLLGSEVNILDTRGTLDLDECTLDKLDLVIAGIHGRCWQGGTPAEDTQGMIAAIENPRVHIISHPVDGTAAIDIEAVVLAARDAHTLLEVNNHSLAPSRRIAAARPGNLELLRQCKRHDVPVILGSDAHYAPQIANYDRLWPLIDEVDFPMELILNHQPQAFVDYLSLGVVQ